MPRRRRNMDQQAPDAPIPFFRPAPHRRSGGMPKPPWVIDMVLRLYAEGGKSYGEVTNEFNRLYAHEAMTICRSSVHAWVQKHRIEAKEVQSATHNRFPDHAPANLRWCLDVTGKADATGALHFILGIIDYGVRFVPKLEVLEGASAWLILSHLFAAIHRYGKPRIIRTDNAPVFHSKVFRTVMAAAGIRHEFTEPGKPWQNGRIERLFLTLKQKLNLIVPKNRLTLNLLLGEFAFWYNEVRPHQHLHGLTPAEAWRGIDPYTTPSKSVRRFSGWGGLLRGFYMRR